MQGFNLKSIGKKSGIQLMGDQPGESRIIKYSTVLARSKNFVNKNNN